MSGLRRAAVILGLLCGLCATAAAQQREAAAKEAFFAGKTAYEAGRYDEALEQFKRSYTLGGQSALLYNIASTLQNLNRPGEAADALREYASLHKDARDRAELEARIASLDRAQALLDREAARKRQQEEEDVARRRRELEMKGAQLTQTDAEQRLELRREHDRERRRKRGLALGLGIGLGALAVGGIIAGVVCGTGHCSSTPAQDYDFGKVTVTR